VRPPNVYLLLVLAAAAGAAAACGSSTETCTGTPPNIVGTYDLVSYTLGGVTLGPPTETGELRIHASTYGISLAGATALADSGTYTQCGSSGISQSSVLGLPQFTGTAILVNDTLSVAGTAAGTSVSSVWSAQ
jgi:hypothetical protein